LVRALRERGDEVTVLSRDAQRARTALGVEAVAWDPTAGPAPVDALAGRDGVVNLAGESVDKRWTPRVKQAIRESRVTGTRNLVAGLRAAEPRPRVLVSASAAGIYGPRGDETVDEAGAPGDDTLAQVAVDWERAAEAATELGLRVVEIRTGIALAPEGGALKQMLTPFRLGVGGPVAGGRQYFAWIHIDDLVGLFMRGLDDPSWSGAFNGTAPEPVTNREFSKALGRALGRPAVVPVPKLALRALFGDGAYVVASGWRAVPRRALEHGFEFSHPRLSEALSDLLG
jgi:uncharacterized protein (TIGR01777 family)